VKHKLLIGAAVVAAGVGGYFVWKRGRAVHNALGQAGGLVPTVRAGISSLVTDLKKQVPSSGSGKAAPVPSPTFAGVDPRQSLRVPTHSRRMNSLIQPRRLQSKAELARQGIAT